MTWLLPLAGCVPAGGDGFVVELVGSVADGEGVALPGAELDFVGDTGAVIGTTSTDAQGAWRWPVLATERDGNVLSVVARTPSHAEGVASFMVNFASVETATLRGGPNQTWDAYRRDVACIRLDANGDAVSVSGRIVDPGGDAVEGLSGVVQRGWDAGVGAAPDASFVTAADGGFSAAVPSPGLYTVYVAPTGGWAGTRFPVMTTPFAETVTATIAPLQEPGRLLASVWWASALDLDLHFSAPERDADATGPNQRMHVWADQPHHPVRGESAFSAELIRSAPTGPGPEVVVLNTPAGAGQIRLSVVDRSNLDAADSTSLAASRALLQWWLGEDIPRYAWVNPLAVATAWRATELDARAATVYAVETYSSGLDPADDHAF
ncbi:MAG: carboxypeptidase regulatory-like domain-containing protein [Myxococcales bacterium]|nr:carboxypeptidase regulatory-like domain-containing protein [Myxococcales bacterium]